MGKIKSHKASSKRFTFTSTGKIKMNHAGRRHKTGLKVTKRKRILRKVGYVASGNAANIKKILPYA